MSVLCLLAAGLVSCSSCASTTPSDATPTVTTNPTVDPVPSVDPPPVQDLVVSRDNWSFSLPVSEKFIALPEECDASVSCSVGFMNGTKTTAVVFFAEEFTDPLDVYAILSIRGAKEAGATIVSTEQVQINGVNYVLVETTKGVITVWMWVAADGKKGYGLTCGGPTNNRELCFRVANTLNID